MDKYLKLYRSISSADIGLALNRYSIRKAPLLFGKNEADQIINLAKQNRKYYKWEKSEAKQRLFKFILKERKQNFKTHCVECGNALLPVDDPKKAVEYEERGNYCVACHNKANQWAKRGFYDEDIATILGLWWKPKKHWKTIKLK